MMEFIETVLVTSDVIADVYRVDGDEAVAVLTSWDEQQAAWENDMLAHLDAASHPW